MQLAAKIVNIGGHAGLKFVSLITEKELTELYDIAYFEHIQKVNVSSAFNLCKLCYPYLKKSIGAGRIASISSMASFLGFSMVIPYSVSKAAVVGMTRGLSVEWAHDNILINSIAPGWFPSEMNKQIMDVNRQEKILARMPLHRYGKPEELAIFREGHGVAGGVCTQLYF